VYVYEKMKNYEFKNLQWAILWMYVYNTIICIDYIVSIIYYTGIGVTVK